MSPKRESSIHSYANSQPPSVDISKGNRHIHSVFCRESYLVFDFLDAPSPLPVPVILYAINFPATPDFGRLGSFVNGVWAVIIYCFVPNIAGSVLLSPSSSDFTATCWSTSWLGDAKCAKQY
jgi:hypothetical protein